MTTHKITVCLECGTPYYYQTSGNDAPEYNHSRMCIDCAKIILSGGKGILRKFEWKNIKSNEYSLSELKEIEKSNPKKTLFGLPLVKIYPCLIDLENPSNKNIRGEADTPNGTFSYSYWTETENIEIYKKVYWDLENNKPSDYQPKFI